MSRIDIAVQEVVVNQRKFPRSKRVMDIVGSALALLLLLPIFIVVALLVFITDGGPVIFRQVRSGLGGKSFYLYKFRTMRSNAEEILKQNPAIYRKFVENDYKLPEGEDPRVTKLGRILRKTSLDELPQFWNVLKGDMSLVGPRPIIPEEQREYGSKLGLFMSMKPGITGLWQVSGRSDVKYPERTKVELSYVDAQSFWLDISIVLRTVVCVLKRRGAH